jgi:hypothetical protein
MSNNYYHKSKFDLFIQKSKIINSGLGIFTNDFIKANTFIDYYFGEYTEHLIGGEYFFRITEKNNDDKNNDDKNNDDKNNDDKNNDDNINCGINAINLPRCYMAMLNDASYRPTSKRKLKKFIEHNYKINKKIEIHSLVDIQIGEELFIFYGLEYWT